MIDHARHAASLRSAYAKGPIAPIWHAEPQATVDDAYRIQAINCEQWRRAGRAEVGAKIGLTSEAVQNQLGVDQPDSGVLFADMQVGKMETVAQGRLWQPRVEAEIAFVLAQTISEVDCSPADLIGFIAYALPALEIVDSRISDWDINIVDTIADNASAGLFVVGETPVDVRSIDLTGCKMRLEKNGRLVSEGSGSACLGNPLHALLWLASKRIASNIPLQAGDIILSGALGAMVAATSGDRFFAQIDGVGQVGVDFA